MMEATMETVEVTVETRDRDQVQEVIDALRPADVEEWEPVRDPITILAVMAAAAELAQSLLSLKEKWSGRHDAATVTVRTADGRTIEITGASDEAIRELVRAST